MDRASNILPGARVPELDIPLVGGGRFDVRSRRPDTFTVIVAYRGLHCPICSKQLKELVRMLPEFSKRGCEPVAVSMDTRERAEQTVEEWGLGDLPVGYDLSEPVARAWGLFLSRSIKEEEPALFSEPGLFLVRPDATLYAASVQSMPFARPPLQDLLGAIDLIQQKDYPPRGEVAEEASHVAA